MFWAAELSFLGALGYLRGFNQVDNQMGWLYHLFRGQKMFEVGSLRVDMGNPGLNGLIVTRPNL